MSMKTCYETPTGAIVTPKGRLTFVALAEKFVSKADKAKGKTQENDGAHIVCICFPPDVDLTVLKKAVGDTAKEKFGDKVKGLKNPIRDAAENDRPGHEEGWFMVRAKTFQAPGVIDPEGNPVNKRADGESNDDVKERTLEECYSGRWARISVMPNAYDTEGNKGVNLYLNNVQLLDHDEPLGGRRSRPEDDFGVAPSAGASGAGTAAAESADDIFD